MSLDLYLRSRKPVTKTGTGVYVRRNGTTFELETIEEVKAHFPNVDVSNIVVQTRKTNEIWRGSQTHNLTEMANHIKAGEYNFYQLLWHPEGLPFLKNEVKDEMILNKQYLSFVREGYNYMLSNKEALEAFNPDNGWGSYDSLKHFVESLLSELDKLDLNSGNYSIYAWT